MIKITQCNINRSLQAYLELKNHSITNHTDITLIQEPPKNNFYSSSITLLSPDSSCPIAIFNPHLIYESIPTNSPFLTAIKLTHLSTNIILISTYLPPNSDIRNILQLLHTLIQPFSHLPIIISGDLNSHHTLWNNRSNTPRGTLLQKFITSSNLTFFSTPNPSYQHQDGRSSFIDLTLSNPLATPLIQDFTQHPLPSFSDHTPQSFSLHLPTPSPSPHPSTWIFTEDKADWQYFKNNFVSETISQLDSQISNIIDIQQIDSATESFSELVLNTAYKSLPRKPNQPKHHPHNPLSHPSLKLLIKDVKYFKNHLHRTTNPSLKNIYLNKYLLLKNLLKIQIQKLNHSSWSEFNTPTSSPWGNSYKFINNKMKNKIFISPIISSLTTQSQLSSLTHTLFPSNPSLAAPPLPYTPSPIHFPFSKLRTIIENLNPKKSPGPDHITNLMLKNLPSSLQKVFHKLILKCLSFGYFPLSWRKSSTIIIPKPNKPNPLSPKSYRPISLLSHPSKILEKTIHLYLQHHLHHNNLLNTNQYGFTPGKSTIDALSKIQSHITNSPHKYKVILTIDFQGAFDNAPHKHILDSLSQLNTPPFIISCIAHFLHNRIITTTTSHISVSISPTGCGCPQGGVLSPILWNVLLNSLLNQLTKHNIFSVAYADDLTILISHNSLPFISDTLHNTLALIKRWSLNHSVPINHSKTSITPLSTKPIPLLSQQFNCTPHTKILGITFSANQKFDLHVKIKIEKIIKYLNILKRHLPHKFGLPSPHRLTLLKNYILPSLLYGSQIWGNKINFKTKRLLNTTYNNLLRNSINCFSSTPLQCLYLLTSSPPIEDIINIRSIPPPPPHPTSIINPLTLRIFPFHQNISPNLTLHIQIYPLQTFLISIASITNPSLPPQEYTFKLPNTIHKSEALLYSIKKLLKLIPTPYQHIQVNTNTTLTTTYLNNPICSSNLDRINDILTNTNSTLFIKHTTNQSLPPPSLNSNNPNLKYNFTSRKFYTKIIKQKLKDKLKIISENCNKPIITQLFSDNLLPTHITQAISSLLTTHGPTREYLYRIWNISPNPNCPTCNTPQTYEHIILQCPQFQLHNQNFNINNNEDLYTNIKRLIKNQNFKDYCQIIHSQLRTLNSHLKYNVHSPSPPT